MAKTQKELIAEATRKAIQKRDRYAREQIDSLVDVLETAEKEVKTSLLHYKNLGSLTKGKFISQKAQKRLQGQIREITGELNKSHSLIMTKAVKTTYKQGMYDGIEALVKGRLPDYADLTESGMNKLLADGIIQKIQLGIVSGKDVSDIVRDMGSVIKDPKAFRKAGKKVFKTAQTRLTVIARTEIIRSHNQGQIKFYNTVGVKTFIWQTAEDERTCPICHPLDGKRFVVGKDPGPPAHPNGKCWTVPEISEDIKTPQEIAKKAKN